MVRKDSQKIHFKTARLTKGDTSSPAEKMNFIPLPVHIFVLIVHTAELKTAH